MPPAPVQPQYMQREGEIGDAEPLMHVALAALRASVGACIEVPHCLVKVAQCLLLDIL